MVEQAIQQAAAQVEGLWNGVVDAGDDLAGKYHMVSNVTKMAGSSPRLQRDLEKMRVINAAIVTEAPGPCSAPRPSSGTPRRWHRPGAQRSRGDAHRRVSAGLLDRLPVISGEVLGEHQGEEIVEAFMGDFGANDSAIRRP
jgi:hypothetical protein